MNPLILFDIDGTILYPGTLARRLMNEAVVEYTGKSPDLQIEDVAGFTDPSIIRKALWKVECDSGEIAATAEKVLEIYLARLTEEYGRYREPYLYGDAVRLLRLCKGEGWHVGILTGNLRQGAKTKLARFNIWNEFDMGLFGDDASAREDLLWIAPEVAWEELREAYTHDRMVLVGDTPNDARVATLQNVRSLIVCRRPEWRSEIEAHDPTMLVESFNDTEPIITWLKGK